MTYLEKIANAMIKKFDKTHIPSLARAMQDSLKLDENSKPKSVKNLIDEYEFPNLTLYKAGIVLDRNEAVEFLLDIPVGYTKSALLRNIINKSNYEKKLGRKIRKAGNFFLYSYGELLFLVGFKQKIPFPEVLLKYLDK